MLRRLVAASTLSILTTSVVYGIEFQPRVSLEMIGDAFGLEHGDFDGDGRLDVAVGSNRFLVTTTFFGQPDGSLGSPIETINPSDLARTLAAGDFDKDGREDIAFSEGNNVAIMYGEASQGFRDLTLYPGGGSTSAIVTTDIDDDGFLDLVKVSQWTNRMNVLFGLPGGAFTSPTGYTVGNSPRGVAVADFNRDGYNDIATSNRNDDDISILYGSAVRDIFTRVDIDTVAARPEGLISGDFNQDTIPDLAYTSRPGNAVEIMYGTTSGAFSTPVQFIVSDNPMSIDAGDLNRDGILDIATSDGADEVSVLLGLGDGSFSRLPDLLMSANGSSSVDIADLNGDGYDDIAVTAASGPYLDVFYAIPEPSSISLLFVCGIAVLWRR